MSASPSKILFIEEHLYLPHSKRPPRPCLSNPAQRISIRLPLSPSAPIARLVVGAGQSTCHVEVANPRAISSGQRGMDDRALNRDAAPGAAGFDGCGAGRVDRLGKGPEALRTGNCDVYLSGSIVAVGWNPDGRQITGAAAQQRLAGAGHVFHDAQQESRIGSFLIEGVGSDSLGEITTRKGAAHGDDANGGKAAPDHGKKFKSSHARHVEVGEDEVGNLLPDCRQSGEAVRGVPY